ncbi:ATP synthase mitochondrial F1 complex assembly factor 2 [Heterostelium album PN500]|uniref:ATP synthase mitochondrial F1 complex assembly factor 2 n=1 Tax=Heterostelium pallidum (strain ATCC 26659 / Pp 5 / PN500) TaxID=670386 RepID=D3AZW0_HETP5|nr:ATP synthase mitochondrial F1 complex assembly factor 2 [Heterostelium album PN500]EFA84584.1 ATP synthase mitochondrial F1 complex assembly factor 2 [Heterostelium album PN500]|eukprot:XP_020436697.1 ATP synthase mitochondrial F1 complex assembly factor 2 [Heterostelium album PN500]
MLGRTYKQIINNNNRLFTQHCRFSTVGSAQTTGNKVSFKISNKAAAEKPKTKTINVNSVKVLPIDAKLSSTSSFNAKIVPETKIFKGEILLEGIKNDGTSLRWYKHVGYTFDAENNGYLPLLDNRPMKTVNRKLFIVPTKEIAMAIATEWMVQGKYIMPHRLPLTTVAATCIDMNPESRQKCIDELIGHLATDQVCNRDSDETQLKKLQNEAFDDLLHWSSDYYGKPFYLSFDLDLSRHPPSLLKTIREHLESMNNWQLLCMQTLTTSTKSFLISLNLYYNRVRLDKLYKIVALEEEFQSETWGKIPFGHDLAEMETLNEIAPALFVLRSIDPLPLPNKPKN